MSSGDEGLAVIAVAIALVGGLRVATATAGHLAALVSQRLAGRRVERAAAAIGVHRRPGESVAFLVARARGAAKRLRAAEPDEALTARLDDLEEALGEWIAAHWERRKPC